MSGLTCDFDPAPSSSDSFPNKHKPLRSFILTVRNMFFLSSSVSSPGDRCACDVTRFDPVRIQYSGVDVEDRQRGSQSVPSSGPNSRACQACTKGPKCFLDSTNTHSHHTPCFEDHKHTIKMYARSHDRCARPGISARGPPWTIALALGSLPFLMF